MLKKRILASSMASVMALSSVSVVAFADEDATKKYGEAVTKAELKEYIDSLESFIDDKLPEYGSTQGEKFQAAVDHAQTVIDNDKSLDTDYAAAFQMVKAVKDSLAIHTNKELAALVKENEAIRNKENKLNEEIEDNIYTEESFDEFKTAYDDAEGYVDSDDSTLVTDAYINLSDAVAKLAKLNTVKKSEFRAVLKEYELFALEAAKYEPWRRGTVTVLPTTGTSKNISNLKKIHMEMSQLLNLGAGQPELTYWDGEQWKGIKASDVSDDDKKDHEGQGRWIGSYDIDGGEDLETFINDQYEYFDNIKSATETSEKRVVAAYEACADAVAVFKGWQEDKYKSGSKGKCDSLEQKYHAQLVEVFNFDAIAAIAGAVEGLGEDDEYKTTYKIDKSTLTSKKKFYIVKDKESGLMVGEPTDVYETEAEAKEAAGDGEVAQGVAAGTNILKYIPSKVEDGYTIASGGAYFEAFAAHLEKKDDDDATNDGVFVSADYIKDSTDITLAGKVKVKETKVTDPDTGAQKKVKHTITVKKKDLPKGTKSDFVISEYVAIDNDTAADSLILTDEEKADTTGALAVHNALYAAVKEKYDDVYPEGAAKDESKLADLQAAVADAQAEDSGMIDPDDFGKFKVKKKITMSAKDADDNLLVGNGTYAGTTYFELTAADGLKDTGLKLMIKKNNEALIALQAKEDNLVNAKAMAADAMADYNAYLGFDFKESDDDKESAHDIMNILVLPKEAPPATGGPKEWTLIWRHLAYQLEDAFPETSTSDYTLTELKKLIDDAYDVAEATGDASLFAEKHMSLVTARQDAVDWYAAAKNTSGWKTSTEIYGQVIGDIYDTLDTEVSDLNKWLKDFKYSYEEIRTKIGTIAVELDKGSVTATADLTKALAECAYDLSVLEASDIYKNDGINPAFETDRTFQPANRLKTGNSKAGDKIKPNDFEKDLLASYEALGKAYEAAKAPAQPAGSNDVNGDGVVDFGDVEAVIDAMLTGSTDAKFDLNKDSVVDFSDVEKAIDNFLAAMA